MFEPKFNKPNMESKTIFGFLVAVFTVAMLGAFVSATQSLEISNVIVEIDDVFAGGINAVIGGSQIPVTIRFTANESASDVEVSAWFQGFRSETRVDKEFADLIEGSRYISRLSVNLPSDLDDNDVVDKDLVLIIRIESDEGNFEKEITVKAQRQSHNLDFLLVEFDSSAKMGSVLPVSVVLKNVGRHEEEDTLVSVSIPELGISKTAFFEDLFPIDVCDNDGDCDRSDSRERKLFLTLPTNVEPGVYQVKVTARSDETESTVVRPLTITGTPVESKVLANPSSKTFAVGETVTYELILVNTGNEIAIYNLVPEASDALSISLSDTITTVSAGSSKTVKVYAKANREGTYNFTVNVVSEGFSEKATYSATVEGESVISTPGSNVVVLTIVLAIVFVVLLVILIVLLTRKPTRSEEFGESYY